MHSVAEEDPGRRDVREDDEQIAEDFGDDKEMQEWGKSMRARLTERRTEAFMGKWKEMEARIERIRSKSNAEVHGWTKAKHSSGE
jgi:hypothetical protein